MQNHGVQGQAAQSVSQVHPSRNGHARRHRRRRRWQRRRAARPWRPSNGRQYEHSYCFMCSTYFYDQLLSVCPRCGGQIMLLSRHALQDLGLLRRALSAESVHLQIRGN